MRGKVLMSEKTKLRLRDGAVTLAILVNVFFVGLIIQELFDAKELVAPLFILAVFLVAMLTNGYIFGIISTIISVLAVNYAFSFPYFAFNFTITENILSAVILILVASCTSTLTTKIKEQEKIKLAAEKERMRANLLRAVSHDLRTPLTGIYGASSTVIENYEALSDEQKREIISGIRQDSQWLISMVENLLSITRIDSNSVKLHKSSIVTDELTDTVLGKFSSRYPQWQVKLSLPEQFTAVKADGLLIQQVMLNLLENAVQHAKGMTELELSIVAEENQIIFEVTDDGCGCDEEKLKSIFKGTYKSDSAVSDGQKKFMGIGLSVCRAIVAAHGGEIYARNRTDGGMTFGFTLERENYDE